MNLKLILAVLIVLLVAGSISFIYLGQNRVDGNVAQNNSGNFPGSNEQSGVPPLNNSLNNSSSGTTAEDTSGLISLDELATHDSKADCWVVYDGKVYDVTSYLSRHPGGAGTIVPTCGSVGEFTRAFEGQHGKSKVGMLMKVGTFIGYFEVVGELS